MTAALGLLGVVLLTAGTALFVAAEFALVTLDRSQVERRAANGDRGARSVLTALRGLSFQLSGAQLGITVTTLGLGYVAEPAIASLLRPLLRAIGLPTGVARGLAVALALILATLLSMIFGELVPKNWALARPFRVARAVVGPTRAFSRACRPVIAGLNGAANRVVRRLGVEPQEELRSARGAEELASLVRTSGEEGTLGPRTAAVLSRTLRFAGRDAADVMTPRTRIVALAHRATVADLVRTAQTSGHSRFPVYGRDIDDVTGLVHVKAAFGVTPDRRPVRRVDGLARPVLRVPTSLDCETLLTRLRAQGLQLAVVVDEFGGTAGIVTLEDLVEELVGEVADEHDRRESPDVVPEPDGALVVSGLLASDEVGDATGYRLPAGPYDTLAGFVVHRLGRIPAVGDGVEARPIGERAFRAEVVAMDGHRVDRIRLRPAEVRATP